MPIDDFHPQWLEPSGRCLYAALHGGRSARAAVGVVLVPPLLHELAGSRRFLTEVAAGLAANGVPCLRFDFFGSGDSGGSGDRLDFASMHEDLDTAMAALRLQTGACRVVALAWRGAALVVNDWNSNGGRADRIVYWEPIIDGTTWLRDLERQDADERRERPGPRSGVRNSHDVADGQLMGYQASARLRQDLRNARLEKAAGNGPRPWAVVRPDVALPLDVARRWGLPDGAPSFQGNASMDATFFLTPPVQRIVDELGVALREESWA